MWEMLLMYVPLYRGGQKPFEVPKSLHFMPIFSLKLLLRGNTVYMELSDHS